MCVCALHAHALFPFLSGMEPDGSTTDYSYLRKLYASNAISQMAPVLLILTFKKLVLLPTASTEGVLNNFANRSRLSSLQHFILLDIVVLFEW